MSETSVPNGWSLVQQTTAVDMRPGEGGGGVGGGGGYGGETTSSLPSNLDPRSGLARHQQQQRPLLLQKQSVKKVPFMLHAKLHFEVRGGGTIVSV